MHASKARLRLLPCAALLLTFAASCARTESYGTSRTTPGANEVELAVAFVGNGTGRITSIPDGIDCGPTCSGSFPRGHRVTLTAVAATGSTFLGWSEDCAGEGACTLALDEPRRATAVFVTAVEPLLKVQLAGAGSGTVVSQPAGIDCGIQCTTGFSPGASVVLTAAPAAGSYFAGWEGDCPGTADCKLVMDRDRRAVARFEKNGDVELRVDIIGAGLGAVISRPAGIDCGATCSAAFPGGTRVALGAAAVTGAGFAGWSGDCSGTGECTVDMAAPRHVVATFERVSPAITVRKTGNGSGRVTSSPAGIDCGAACEAPFPWGSTVALTAAPDADSQFVGWSGRCSGTAACSVTVDGTAEVEARFEPRPVEVAVELAGDGLGKVVSSPAGIDCGATCRADFPRGSFVTLEPTAAAGSGFEGWSGDCAGSGACVLRADAPRRVTAKFARNRHRVTVTLAGTGQGSVRSTPARIACAPDCAATFAEGDEVVLDPTPSAGSTFAGWSGACHNVGGFCVLRVDGPKSVVATFNEIGATPRWCVRMGGLMRDEITSVAVNASGAIVAAGRFTGPVSLGGPVLDSTAENGFAARFTSSGAHVWSRSIGGPKQDVASAIGIDATGAVTVAGAYGPELDYNQYVPNEAFLARYSPAGDLLGSTRFPVAITAAPTGLAASPLGSFVVVGRVLDATLANPDAFLGSFNATGAAQWAKQYGSYEFDESSAVALDPAGNALVTGRVQRQVDFGGGPVDPLGFRDAYLARYSPVGTLLWAKRFGAYRAEARPVAIATNEAGGAVIAGTFGGTLSFGGALLTNTGQQDAFIALFSAAGAHLWSRRLGGSPLASAGLGAVAVDKTGNVYVAGNFHADIDLGGTTLYTSSSATFVAKYRADGALAWASRIDSDSLWISSMTWSETNGLVAGGGFSGSLNCAGTLVSAGGRDAVLMNLSP